MRKLCVVGLAFASSFADAKEPIKFMGKDWAVDLSISVVARVSAVTGKTWLYIDLDDERDAAFGMELGLVLHAFVGEKECKMPLDMDDNKRAIRRSYSKELGVGSVVRAFLELQKGYGTGTRAREAYSGPVFADVGCIRDYLRARRMDGVAARQLMSAVVATGCLRTVTNANVIDLTGDRNPVVSGMKKAHVLFDGEDGPQSETGYIFPSLRRAVTSETKVEIPAKDLPMRSGDLAITLGAAKTDN